MTSSTRAFSSLKPVITKETFQKPLANRGLFSQGAKRLVLNGHTVRRAERGFWTGLFKNKPSNSREADNRNVGNVFFQVLVDTYGLDRANQCSDLLRSCLEKGSDLDVEIVRDVFTRLEPVQNGATNPSYKSKSILERILAPFRWIKDLHVRWVRLKEANCFNQHFLHRFDLRLKKVPGAGDCFFYAIAYQLNAATPSVRLNLYETMQNARRAIAEQCCSQRAAEIREPATHRSITGLLSWGEAADAPQVAKAYDRPVIIVSEDQLARGIFLPDGNIIPFDLSSEELRRVINNNDPKPIILIHNGTNHWDAVDWSI